MSRLLSIGLGSPKARVSAADAYALAAGVAPAKVSRDALATLHRRSGVEERGAAGLAPGALPTLPASGADRLGPPTSERLACYTALACEIGARAGADALSRASVDPARITHLVTASCTGFEAPGFDQALVRDLGLRPTVRRTHVGFMGCHAAVNALAAADAFARADPRALCLVVCAEVCSLHYHHGDRTDRLIANALFADGAASAVVSASGPESAPSLGGFASALFPDSASEMSWLIGDHGFEMSLAPTLPETLRRAVPAWVRAALDGWSLARRDVGAWAIHPGGPRVVGAVADALGLSSADTAPSLETLRAHGNMSSPTILFILRRLWDSDAPRPWVGLAFGPGLAGEALVVR